MYVWCFLYMFWISLRFIVSQYIAGILEVLIWCWNLKPVETLCYKLTLLFSPMELFYFFFGFPQDVLASLRALWLILVCGGRFPLATRCCNCWDLNWSKPNRTLEPYPVVDKPLGHTWWLLWKLKTHTNIPQTCTILCRYLLTFQRKTLLCNVK